MEERKAFEKRQLKNGGGGTNQTAPSLAQPKISLAVAESEAEGATDKLLENEAGGELFEVIDPDQ